MNWIQNTALFLTTTNGWRKRSFQKLLARFATIGLVLYFSFYNMGISAQISMLNHNNCSNFVRIEGSSNVNQFYFEQNVTKPRPGITIYQQSSEYIELELPVKYFEASNPRMRNDFMELIKASDYPYISIFIKLSENNFEPQLNQKVTSTIKVKLAGQEKEYQLPGTIHVCENNSLRLQGTLELDIKDFNLKPPTKFMGMVKVNREVFIKFGLIINNNLLTKSH